MPDGAPLPQNFAEAERRIEAVRSERGDRLDLSGLRLRAVPDSVAGLTWLRELKLNDNRLSELPGSLANLTGLTHLDLKNNWLAEVPGWIAGLHGLTWLELGGNQIIEIPGWIGGLTNLTVLGLYRCGLDTVPEWIAGLSELTELDLESNQLAEIPESLGDLARLTKLWLYDNRLRTLPVSLARLTRLADITLDQNQFTEIPEWIGGLPELTRIDIGGNRLTEVPSWLGNITALTRLDLTNCRLAEVPEWLEHLTRLTELNVADNRLTKIPEWIGGLTALTTLELQGNRLRSLPESLTRLTKLTRLDIDSNQLTELPPSIGQLTDLTWLGLSNNRFAHIPDWLGNLTGLTGLYLGTSRLKEVPEWIANLSSLTALSLENNQLTEIPEWIGDLPELARLLLYGNRLSALPESLTRLTKLTRLDIDSNQLTELPPWIGQLTELTSLDVGMNQFRELPDSMSGLTSLRRLHLSDCGLTTPPTWLANFTELTQLYLANNELAALPGTLENLEKLETLYLSDNKLTALPAWLGEGKHERITGLYLNGNQFGEVPDVIRSLTRLRTLSLANNELTEIPGWLASSGRLSALYVRGNQLTGLPAELGKLTWLTRLDLSGNQFANLPDWLAGMRGLTELDLTGNRLRGLPDWIGQLTGIGQLRIGTCDLDEVPPWIGRLTGLFHLDLSDNEISFLPDSIASLAGLRALDLDDNKLTGSLPDWVGDLTGIKSLYISGNELAELPDSLRNLTDLLYFNASSNKLTEAPDWLLDLPNLERLSLADNPTLLSPPPEIAASGTKSVLAFLKARRKGATRQWISKLLVVGEGGVGKTSLVKALTGAEHDPDEETTHGIRVDDLTLRHPDHGDIEMTLSTWDFGGQQIYHATHQFFLTDRSLFLLLWNTRLGWEQGRLRYWLDIIKSRAPQSPVLLVATHADASQRPADLPLEDLRREYPQIAGSLVLDNQTRRGLGDARGAIARQAADLPLMGTEWPTTWLNAAQAVKGCPENHITPERMWRLMATAGVTDPDQQRYIAVAMHQLGDILYYHDDPELEQTVVLSPEWVNRYISDVLDSAAVDSAHGLLTHAEMTRLWADLDRGMRDHFLGMMDKYEISFRVDDEPAGVVSLVVERLPWNPPPYEDQWNQARGAPGTSEIRVIYQLNTTPPGIPTWFIARSHRFTANVHWRTGAVLAHPDGRHTALVRANPGRNTVELAVRGPTPAAFFSVLDDGFNRTLERYPGLEIKRLIPCPCAERGTDGERGTHEDRGDCTELFEYDDLQSRLRREPPRHEIECRKSGEDVDVRRLLYGLAPSERDSTRAGIERLTAMVREMTDRQADQAGKIAHQHEYTQRMFLKLLRVLQDQQEVRCPSVFSLVPTKVRATGTWLTLRLYCEEPGAWHPLPGDAGSYEINEPASWLRKIKPHLSQLLTVLKHAAPLAGPVLGMTVAHMSERLKSEIETMTELVSQIPEPSHSSDSLDPPGKYDRPDPGPAGRADDDAGFRALDALLSRLDPNREWGGLSRTVTPEGLTLYLCREHGEAYHRAARL